MTLDSLFSQAKEMAGGTSESRSMLKVWRRLLCGVVHGVGVWVDRVWGRAVGDSGLMDSWTRSEEEEEERT